MLVSAIGLYGRQCYSLFIPTRRIMNEGEMANIARMTVVFTEPMAAEIRAAVEAGEYASTSEAVRDAVRLWTSRRQLREQDVSELRTAWDRGLASGFVGPLDLNELRRDARKHGATSDDSTHDD